MNSSTQLSMLKALGGASGFEYPIGPPRAKFGFLLVPVGVPLVPFLRVCWVSRCFSRLRETKWKPKEGTNGFKNGNQKETKSRPGWGTMANIGIPNLRRHIGIELLLELLQQAIDVGNLCGCGGRLAGIPESTQKDLASASDGSNTWPSKLT
jgi:hypothetical protein